MVCPVLGTEAEEEEAVPVCRPHCPDVTFKPQKVLPFATSVVVAPFVLSLAGALPITSFSVYIVPIPGATEGSVKADGEPVVPAFKRL